MTQTSVDRADSRPAIRLRDVEMRFDGVRALRDVSFTVAPGSLCGLVGPNGAGKTTSLRLIATDLVPSDGTVEVLGFDARFGADDIRPRIGYMPDNAGLYEELTLDEYLGFFAAFYGIPRDRRSRRVQRTIELTGMGTLRGRRLRGLSKGERQRVLLARALVHDPQLLVLDEPADGLDPRGRVELRELLLLLHEQGKTILISSHILADLEQICTDLILIDKGRVAFAGGRERLTSSGLQRCRVRVEVQGEVGPLLEALAQESGVTLSDPDPDGVEIEIPTDPAFSTALLARLVESRIPVVSFSRSLDSLEQVYLRLTEEAPETP